MDNSLKDLQKAVDNFLESNCLESSCSEYNKGEVILSCVCCKIDDICSLAFHLRKEIERYEKGVDTNEENI